MIAAVLAVALLLSASSSVDAHAGHLHPYPSVPEAQGFIATQVATCTFEPVKAAAAAASTAVVQEKALLRAAGSGRRMLQAGSDMPMNMAGMDMGNMDMTGAYNGPTPNVTGTGIVWSYLYHNCSNQASSSIEVKLTATANGKPAGNYTLTGYGRTGVCGAASSQNYWLNTTALNVTQDTDEYQIWFHDAATNITTGQIWGNAANAGTVRTTGPESLKSFVLMDAMTNAPVACCNIEPTEANVSDWAAPLEGRGGYECDDNYQPINATTSSTDSSTGSSAFGLAAGATAAVLAAATALLL